jgi:hypothetical protein
MADPKTEKKNGAEKADEKKVVEKAPEKAETKAEDKVDSKSADEGGELANVYDEDGTEKSKEKAPEKGGVLKLSAPEDLKDLVGDLADYVKVASEAGLTQQQLDKVMAVHFDRVKAAAESTDKESERIGLEWKRDLMSDPKLGGANLKQTLSVAERGARALGGSALAVKLVQHLKGEDVIDGPTLIRAFHMAGLSQSEDRLGGSPDAKPKGDDDSGLTPQERQFKKAHPNTWAQMQREKAQARGA